MMGAIAVAQDDRAFRPNVRIAPSRPACSPQDRPMQRDHPYFLRSFRPRRTTVPSPLIVLQNKRVLSQSPVGVRGTIRAAVEIRFFCFETTSLPWTAW